MSTTSPWFDGIAAAVALLLVAWSSKAASDVAIWSIVLFALIRHRTALLRPWMQWPAAGFPLYLLYLLLTVPLAWDMGASLKDMAKAITPLMLACVAPALVRSTGMLQRLLRAFALAITAIVACDFVRLVAQYGTDSIAQARFHEPQLLNHPNVASMMAGIAFFILLLPVLTGAWRGRALIWLLPALALHLGYLVLMASRGPQAAFAVTLVLAGLWWTSRRGKCLWLLACTAAIAVAAINVTSINPRFVEKYSMANLSERTTVWRHTLDLARQHPWMGHGYGKRTFVECYYASNPPRSSFRYPHCHEYWLAIYFHNGAIGVALVLAAWALLAGALIRRAIRLTLPAPRAVAGTVLVLLAFLHVYGLGDYPDSVVRYTLMWTAGLGVAILTHPSIFGQGAPT